MDNSTIIYYISIIGVIFGLRNYKPFTSNKDINRKALSESLPWFGILGILSALRHIVFAGGLGRKYGGLWEKQGKLFEYEAGIANVAFGILCFKAMNESIEVQKSVILGYAIYLFGSMIVHVYTIINETTNFAQKMGTIVAFFFTTLIMFQI